jgi:hypothetical protein
LDFSSRKNSKNPLVLVFGNRYLLENKEIITDIKKEFPYEHIILARLREK